MPHGRVNGFTMSLDGYGAGPDQTLDNPLGIGEIELHIAVSPDTFKRRRGPLPDTSRIRFVRPP